MCSLCVYIHIFYPHDDCMIKCVDCNIGLIIGGIVKGKIGMWTSILEKEKKKNKKMESYKLKRIWKTKVLFQEN